MASNISISINDSSSRNVCMNWIGYWWWNCWGNEKEIFKEGCLSSCSSSPCGKYNKHRRWLKDIRTGQKLGPAEIIATKAKPVDNIEELRKMYISTSSDRVELDIESIGGTAEMKLLWFANSQKPQWNLQIFSKALRREPDRSKRNIMGTRLFVFSLVWCMWWRIVVR